MTASREVWLRPSPDCESTLFVSSRPDIGTAGFPIPAEEGMRFDVPRDATNVVFYVAAENDFDDNLLSVLAR